EESLAVASAADVSLFDQDRQVRPQGRVLDRFGKQPLDVAGLHLAVPPEQPHDLQFAGSELGHYLLLRARKMRCQPSNDVQIVLHIDSRVKKYFARRMG